VKDSRKPVIASWMGGAGVAAGQAVLAQANIPTFPYPDTAARIFTHTCGATAITCGR
jgi:acetyltransferase